MKHLLLLLLSLPVLLFAQSEADRVRIPLNDYITGTSYNYPAQIEQAFIDSATLYLNDRDGNARIFSPKAYAALFAKREAGQFNGRKSRILSVNLHQEVAYAEIEVVIEAIQARFLDLILLKRIGEDWKIISKTATRYPLVPDYEGPVKRVIMEGLRKPWSMAFLSETEVLIAEKDGDLLRVDLATQSRQAIQGFPEDLFQPFVLDVSRYEQGIYPTSLDGKEIRANAGILEVLVDPDFAQNKFV
ncbi:MAG: nuclear transport factor 2 family protein, partial [Bacteroidota bacterium]